MFVTKLAVLFLAVAGARALDNGLAKTPPMGWLTWERFRCNTDCKNYPDSCISERLIREMADAMVSEGYADAGYEYLIIDDCWPLRDRDANGKLQADPDRFPGGIQKLAQYLHSKGLKLGIYGDVGAITCAGYPGSQDHLEQDAKTFAEWEVDYVKFDGCATDQDFFAIGYPEFARQLMATGRDIVYSCEWPLYNTQANYTVVAATCNLWRNHNDIDDSYESFRNIFNWFGDNQDSFADVSGPGGWNDPDMLIIGNYGLSYEQAKAQMAAWALMASPLIMSNDLRRMDPLMKGILQRHDVIKVNQDRLGKQGKRVFNDDGIQIWVRPVEPVVDGANSYAAAIISTRTDGNPHNVQVSLDSIGVNTSDSYIVTELFGAMPTQELNKGATLNAAVNPTGALIFKFEAKSKTQSN